MSPRVDFVETSKRWRGALPARALARQAIGAAMKEAGVKLKPGAEVSVHLVGDSDIQALNARWRGKDAPTNVLSFPTAGRDGIEKAMLLGDILVAFETIAKEAEDEGKTLPDHFRHLVIHGFLHLLGHDHARPEEAEAMEAMEVRALARLGIADPYAAGEFTEALA